MVVGVVVTMLSMFGPVAGNGVWRLSTIQECMDLYRALDIISEIRKGRWIWLGHVARMPEERTLKNVFKNTLEEKGSVENQERDG